MRIIGYELIDFEPFYSFQRHDEKKENLDNFIIDFDEYLIKILKDNEKTFSLKVDNIKDILLANELGAKYIIVDKNLAKKAQDLANYYLFDSKIALIIDDIDEIIELADFGIDSVILKGAIKNGSY